jgi:hypothetical protein
MFLTSTSPALAHTVTKGATHITVLSSAGISVFSQLVTFTATVTAAAPAGWCSHLPRNIDNIT